MSANAERDVHRGWEIDQNAEAAYWGFHRWEAYRGGADLGAPCVTANSREDLITEIDQWEDDRTEAHPIPP